jgi:hypothetical protein
LPVNVAAAGSHVAISRRNGASHANEIILLLNWFRGTTFTFLSLKELTRANCQFSDWHFPPLAEGHVPTKYGLQFFTISMFKVRCDQLKVLTGRKLLRAYAFMERDELSSAMDRFAAGKIGGMAAFRR